MASLEINTTAHSSESLKIPKKVRVLDSELNEVKSFWLQGNKQHSVDLDQGMYAFIMTLPSGKEIEQVMNVEDISQNRINFDLSKISEHESHEWAHASNPIAQDSTKYLTDNKFLGSWIRLWHLDNKEWKLKALNIYETSSWYKDGVSYQLKGGQRQQFIQVGGPGIPWRLVALPPADLVMCLIRPHNGPTQLEHPLEITITSEKWKAEAILTLLNSNANTEAQELFENYAFAEKLVYNKVTNPTSAAIGAYYLLKFEKFDQLHDWPRNLADWFAWMPDGSIIWAWQLIKEGRKSGDVQVAEVRKRLLEACERGLPIYTEGLRLLWEGLKMLSYIGKEDKEVKNALARITTYAEATDWSATVTTFNGISPMQPSKKSRKGTPKETAQLAYIFDVPPKVLIKESAFSTDDVIKVRSTTKGLTELKISKKGLVEPSTGKKYRSIYDAAKQMDLSDDEMLKNVRSANANLDKELRRFRTGNIKFDL